MVLNGLRYRGLWNPPESVTVALIRLSTLTESRMTRSALLVLILSGLAGCDSYIDLSEHQARVEVGKYTGWLLANAEGGDLDLHEIGTVKAGRLREGEEAGPGPLCPRAWR